MSSGGLRKSDVSKVVHDWIGVDGGYLGDFTYFEHDRFWLELCEKEVSTQAFPGTTRACFEATLLSATPHEQALALEAVLDRFRPADAPDPERPKFRSPALEEHIRSLIEALRETGHIVDIGEISTPSEAARKALDDADVLLREGGPSRAVDRIHTALHAYLRAACRSAEIAHERDARLVALIKALQAQHPAFAVNGPRRQETQTVLRALATIVDALDPLRNHASAAHPNEEVLWEAEARLVLNTARTVLRYLDDRLAPDPGTIAIVNSVPPETLSIDDDEPF